MAEIQIVLCAASTSIDYSDFYTSTRSWMVNNIQRKDKCTGESFDLSATERGIVRIAPIRKGIIQRMADRANELCILAGNAAASKSILSLQSLERFLPGVVECPLASEQRSTGREACGCITVCTWGRGSGRS